MESIIDYVFDQFHAREQHVALSEYQDNMLMERLVCETEKVLQMDKKA
jgi:hypothetical protein